MLYENQQLEKKIMHKRERFKCKNEIAIYLNFRPFKYIHILSVFLKIAKLGNHNKSKNKAPMHISLKKDVT